MRFLIFFFPFLFSPCYLLSQITTLNLNAVENTYVSSFFTEVNSSFYNSDPLQVSFTTMPKTIYLKRSFINFKVHLSNIPSNAVIESAFLELGYSANLTITSNNLTLRTCTNNWDQSVNSVNWSNQPTVTTANQVQNLTPVGNVLKFDVKNLVKKLVNHSLTDFGWGIFLSSESGADQVVSIYSKTHVLNNPRPKLIIKYYIPQTITDAVINHPTTATSTDGFILPTITGGAGGNTYKWYKHGSETPLPGATSINLTGVNPGWYGLEVTDALNNVLGYGFLVGEKCKITPITFQPSGKYIDDGNLFHQSGIVPGGILLPDFQNTIYSNSKHIVGLLSLHGYERNLTKFNLWIDPSLEISSSMLTLHGAAHSGSDNRSRIFFNTSYFDEEYPLYNQIGVVVPTKVITNPDTLSIQHRSTSTADFSIEFKSFFKKWQQNNLINNGFTVEPNTLNQSVNQTQSFYSSDYSVAAKRPKVVFQVLAGCEMFAELEFDQDGYYHIFNNGFINFNFYQEYSNSPLIFNIYNVQNNIVKTNANFPTVNTTKGNNSVTLNVSSLAGNCLATGYYLLEVFDSKNTKMYLRVYISNSQC